MAKRFIDCDMWTGNKWFRKLPSAYKIFWFYILAACDSVGVWEEDIELVEILTGEKFDSNEVLKAFKNQIKVINDGKKWWIIDFCDFQYGELREENINNRPHQSYIHLLKKHRLWIDYTKTIYRLKEKDKEKDKDKAKEKDSKKWFEEIWNRYPKKENKKEALRHFNASVKTENDFNRINIAMSNYLDYIDAQEIEYQFIKMGSTWFNNWEDYENFKIPEKKDKGLIQL